MVDGVFAADGDKQDVDIAEGFVDFAGEFMAEVA